MVTLNVRSSGISAWDSTDIWRKRRRKKRDSTARNECCTTSTGGSPELSCRSKACCAWVIRVSANPGSIAPFPFMACTSTCSNWASSPSTFSVSCPANHCWTIARPRETRTSAVSSLGSFCCAAYSANVSSIVRMSRIETSSSSRFCKMRCSTVNEMALGMPSSTSAF